VRRLAFVDDEPDMEHFTAALSSTRFHGRNRNAFTPKGVIARILEEPADAGDVITDAVTAYA
jgi:hypothetical protein